MSQTIITKFCTRCKQIKPVAEFNKSTTARDGLQNWCKECQRVYNHSPQRKAIIKNRVHKVITSKRCPKCGHTLPASSFYRCRSKLYGIHDWCKECQRKISREHMRRVRQTEEGKNHCNELSHKYRHTQKGLEMSRRAYRMNREKKIASAFVRQKVKQGHLPHPSTMLCSVCENRQAEHYHHPKGYDRENRLNVIPVCHICHSNLHSSYGSAPERS